MSSLIVPLTEITEVKPHPNADRLELAIIGGWQVIVGKGNYQSGDRIVYIPPDSVIPQRWSDVWGVTQHLSKGRVKCVKLRGEPSFGFTVPVADLPRGGELYEVGENVAHIFGITKYEPPVSVEIQRGVTLDTLPNHPLFQKYTDIENMRHFPLIIAEGEEVIMTEKIHGTNVRVGMIDGELMIGSHHQRKKIPEDYASSWFSYPLTIEGVRHVLDMLVGPDGKQPKQVILYGETYGKVQKLQYGESGLAFRAFDLLVDGKYVDYDTFSSTCEAFSIPTAPPLYRGPFSLDLARHFSEGKTTIGGDHIREGTVVKPVAERYDPKIGRVVLKYVGDQYLLSGKDEPVGATA